MTSWAGEAVVGEEEVFMVSGRNLEDSHFPASQFVAIEKEKKSPRFQFLFPWPHCAQTTIWGQVEEAITHNDFVLFASPDSPLQLRFSPVCYKTQHKCNTRVCLRSVCYFCLNALSTFADWDGSLSSTRTMKHFEQVSCWLFKYVTQQDTIT